MSKRQPRQTSLFEQKHLRLLGAVEEEMKKIYQNLHLSVSSLLEGVDLDGEGEQFSLKRHPLLDTQVNRLTTQAATQITAVLQKAVRSTYRVSTDKAQDLVNKYLTGEDKHLTTQLLRRAEGVEAFTKQWFDKHPISERVWDITEGFRQEVEERIKADLVNGTPADQISRNIRQYLNEPNKRFRRVRGKDGTLRLSKAAQAYHPGQGVYRSSYKNARRLAITEVNNAYRQADNDRWQQMDFVVGVRVQLSNNHTYRDHKGRLRTLVDICDDLKGDYPKDFQFTSWHPHCRCIATPILKTREEMKRDRQLIREGKSPEGSKKEVTELPDNFKTWQEKNAKRITQATKRGTLPHWLRDNFKPRGNGKLTYRPPAKATTIQQAWLKRNRQRSLQEAKDALINTTTHHPKIGKVHFTGNLIKEAINQPHRDIYYKNLSIKHMHKIIQEAEFAGSSRDSKGRGWLFHYLEYELQGQPSYIVIRDIKGKNTFYSVVDKLTEKK